MKRKWLSIGIILLFVGTCIIPTTAETTEKPLPASRGNWLYVGGSGPGNYTRIQDAVDNASNGDTVFVFAGIYHECIILNKSLGLLGEQALSTIIDSEYQGSVVTITSSETTIKRFTITGGGSTGVGGGVMISNGCQSNVLTDNIICNNMNHGLVLSRCQYATILNNTIANNALGVVIRGQETHQLFSGNIIVNNTLELDDTSNNIIQSNSFQNGDIYQENSGSNNIFKDNLIDNGSMVFMTPMRYTIVNNTFVNSRGIKIDGNSPDYWRYHVIQGNMLNGRPLFYSSMHDNITVPCDAAEVIVAYCSGAHVENLTITGSFGIDLNTCHYSSVSNNTLIDSEGIRLDICQYCTVSNNHLVNSFLTIRSAFSKIYKNEISGAGLKCIESIANTYSHNRISNFNSNGIYIETGISNTFLSNTIENTDIAVYLKATWFNRFLFNNFINSSTAHATFVSEWYYACHNTWIGNYWEGRWGIGPKMILGKFNTHIWVTTGDHGMGFYIFLPFFNIDLLPARKPYDTGVW